MKYLFIATLLLALINPVRAQSLVGAWTYGNTASPTSSGTGTFIFLSNGVYFHAESENTADAANGQNGMERGTYTWDSGTGSLTLNSVAANTNGDWGLSSVGTGNSISFTVTGDSLLADGSTTMTRVTGSSSIVGAWTYGNTLTPTSSGTGAFVFLANGVYFHVESENTADAANGQNGMERGTYSWDSGTNTFTLASVDVNTNGQWGLSHDPGQGNSFSVVVSGNSLIADGGTPLARVSAIPEPSTYAMLAGLAALGLAAWRRRRQTT